MNLLSVFWFSDNPAFRLKMLFLFAAVAFYFTLHRRVMNARAIVSKPAPFYPSCSGWESDFRGELSDLFNKRYQFAFTPS
jgi:hypothetical protein